MNYFITYQIFTCTVCNTVLYIRSCVVTDPCSKKTAGPVPDTVPAFDHMSMPSKFGSKTSELLRTLAGLFMCLICKRVFKQASGLGRHHQATGHGPVHDELLETQRHKRRYKYSFRRKRDLILDVMSLTKEYGGNAKRARTVISHRTGVSASCLDKWVRGREFIFACARTPRLGGKCRVRTPMPQFPEAETMLYYRFIYRRRYQALRVTRRWLRINFKDIRTNLGHDVDGWFPSNGWCSRFCKRWSITSQCRTNKKKFSIEERLPAIQAFHQYWIYGVQSSGVQTCPKYGRYKPSNIYSTDQVPLPFGSPCNRSLNEKGSKRGNRFVAASEDDKRFCTMNVTICAQADRQDIPIEIIFKSNSKGERISTDEKQYFDQFPNVKVRWQASAWADEELCIDFIKDFRGRTLDKGDVVLVMDQHSSQHTPLAKTIMHFLDILPIFTPANCTDCVSPVDRNVGQWIKQKVYILQEDELSMPQNRDWSLPTAKGGLTASEKRKLTVKWVSQAWEEMVATRHHCINSAFVDSGVLVACDGSENHLIRLWPNAPYGMYNF